MSSKSKAFTLHSSSSLSNLFKRSVPAVERSITSKLYRGQQKLLTAISGLMSSAKETSNNVYYLTLEQYKDAVWAARALKEVDALLRSNTSKKYLNKNFKTNFDFETVKVKVNKFGKIYMETAILVQLIDLYNVLGEVIEFVKESSLEGHSEIQTTETEESLDSTRFAEQRLNNLLAELDSNPDSTNDRGQSMSTKEILTALSVPLHNKFIVMPAGTADLPPLTEEQVSDSREDFAGETRRTKSTSSLKHNEVTDAAGARRIIIRCLSDLDKVKNYLYTFDVARHAHEEPATEDEDDDEEPLGTIHHEHDEGEATDEEKEHEGLSRDPSHILERDPSRSMERDPSHNMERDPSHVIERDPSHIIERDPSHSIARDPSYHTARDRSHIDANMTESERRRCCCAEDCPADQPLEFTWKEGDETSSKLVICIKGKTEDDGDVHVVIRQCPECKLVNLAEIPHQGSDQPDPAQHKKPTHPNNFESDILHGKEPTVDCPVSSEDLLASRNNINVIFDPKDPSNSRVEGRKSSAQGHHQAKAEEKMSRIRLNETVNLNLQTDQQNLVISLTVRPKIDGPVPKLSITDIFSDSRTNIPERDRRSFQEPERGPSERGTDRSGSRGRLARSDEEPSHEDVTIPLSRTKVCSSLEFDVQVVDSRMKSSGIKHTNPNIVVRLNDMGVNNLLRACRPVKCGRKAILNESIRKCLPYSPSLKSLPLEEYDADIIDQSLKMSIKKSKHSTIFVRDDKLAYTVEVSGRKASTSNTVKQVYFVQVATPSRSSWVERILGYYINIEKDKTFFYTSIMEVRYFEIENIRKRKDNSIPATILRVKLKNTKTSRDKTNDRSIKVDAMERQSKYPSRIPVYKYRFTRGKKVEKRISQIYGVSDLSSPTERKVKGYAVDLRKLKTASVESQMKQQKSKSVLTMQNSESTKNPSSTQHCSNGTSEYFNKFMRYITLLNSTSSTTKNQHRKKMEFYASRSHPSVLANTKRAEPSEKGSWSPTPSTKMSGKQPDAATNDKGIRQNDVILSSTRFKKQLDYDKTTSRVVVNRLSNFLYENFVEEVTPQTKIEVLRKIDHLLNVYSKFRTKTGLFCGSKDV